MEFRLLGPVEIVVDGRLVPIRRRQERHALAILLLQAGNPVSADRIAELIWAQEPPPSARDVVQTYLSRLRNVLRTAGGESRGVQLERRGHAYVLDVDPETVDVHRFERLVERARTVTAPGPRSELLRQALALWRGPALADIGADAVRERLAARLEESRLRTLDQRIAADLAAGRHEDLLGELTELVARSPLDERLTGHLMVALYRAGRHGDAIQRYRTISDHMRDELGFDPGPDLRDLNTAMLRRDPALDVLVPAAPPAPADLRSDTPAAPIAQLPAAIPHFTGRAALLDRLDAELALMGTGSNALAISTLVGTGGAGKTTLALRWAHQVAHRFPDGQLFVNLRGFGPGRPMRPVEALAGFLRALGVPAETIPVDVDQAAAQYRSMLAGRRILVLLDNALSTEQVRPLLPGDSACFVLVTSRDQLSGLIATHGARRFVTDLFPEHDAIDLLRSVLGDARVTSDSGATAELARRCGYLPLALRIAAAQLLVTPDLPIARYVDALAVAGPLDTLAMDDDPQAAVRETFHTSYARLAPDEQRAFRRLGLLPGTDATVQALAALVDVPPAEAGPLLRRLSARNLTDEHVPGRYTMHDLLRQYAAEQGALADDEAGRAAALDRLLHWYLYTTDAAARMLYPDVLRLDLPPAPAGHPAAGFSDHGAALAWLSVERPNLIAAIRHAADHGPHPLAWLLTDTLRGYFFQSRHTIDWLDAAYSGLAATEPEHDPQPQAALHLSLGAAYYCLNRPAEAVKHYAEAAALAERARWADGQAASAGNLGMVYLHLGKLSLAAEQYEQALEWKRRGGEPAGRAIPLANLGGVYHDLGRLREAAACYTEALALHRQAGSRAGEAIALNNLGEVELELGHLAPARAHLTAALALQREVGKRYGEAETLCHLAGVHHATGERTEALAVAGTALHLAHSIGERRLQANALNMLGTIERQVDGARAQDHHRQALDAAREAGADYPYNIALLGLAATAEHHGRPEDAIVHATQALAFANRSDYRVLQGRAHTSLASAYRAVGKEEPAAEHSRTATAIQRETGYRLDSRSAQPLQDDSVELA